MKHHLILFDFDETYYKHATTKEDIPDLRDLEETLRQAVKEDGVITAFLSGSIFPNILKKMEKAEMKFKPQYIFSDLCSQMYQLDDQGEYHECKEYEEAVSETPFTKEKVDEIIKNFEQKYDVKLQPQREYRDKETLYEYYFDSQGDQDEDIKMLENLQKEAASYDYAVHFNKTNPLAGDPEDAYDVNFTPKNAGKLFAVKYLLDLFDIPASEVLGFGDSGNDETYLSYIGHPFVMSNSTDNEMKAQFPNTKYEYYQGLNDEVKKYLKKIKKD
ncbi:HAD superfamily hydrolase [Staphylococcus piscifermentans]|uniref:Putative hydrolase n=1 Tax=Staphylococcus piscifermentans TaxID=70258 RepID=A0A239UHR4_9STAP|nr:HAD-IIB family hydrolase [Staphylococcus piscifermentans]RTX81869.1 HAD-IIB family hydrolase [Staphylococcus piscifermentans]GEP85011.1 putative hydrolase [Staphylococcus piscifermentans]SNV08928.1 HAD superfamily hydrolase [Staphylococcus piscifermentans]